MDDRIHVGPCEIEATVYLPFGRRFTRLLVGQVRNRKIFSSQIAFFNSALRDQRAVVVKPHGQIAIGGGKATAGGKHLRCPDQLLFGRLDHRLAHSSRSNQAKSGVLLQHLGDADGSIIILIGL